jgi:hypothetical protein
MTTIGIDGREMKGLSLELERAIAIVRSKEFTRENYQALVQLSEQTDDRRIGDMVEAFIAAAPNVDFMDDEA